MMDFVENVRPETAASGGIPEFLSILGLALPVSENDVNEAYRVKVRTAHPDAGGDEQQFIALQQAYEQALQYARVSSGRMLWLGASIERYVEQQALIGDIQRLGGTVRSQSIGWLIKMVGEDFAQVLDKIVEIRLTGPQIDDSAIERLMSHRNLLTALHSLDLSDSRLTDAGALQLTAFPALRTLWLRNTAVTDLGLEAIAQLGQLERIYVRGTRASCLGLLRLRRAQRRLKIAR